MKREVLAYAAGLVDGEGCIAICRDSRNPTHYFVMLSVANRDGTIVDWLKRTFGGAIYSHATHGFNGQRPVIYDWRVYKQRCVPILRDLLPFLKIKKAQARVTLQMAARLDRASRTGGKMWKGKSTITEKEARARESLFLRCRQLKSHFPLSSLVNTPRARSGDIIDSKVQTRAGDDEV